MEIRKNEVKENLASLKEQMKAAAIKAGRAESDVNLIAVSKTKPAEDIRLAYELGQHSFGENRVQELKAKQADPELKDLDISWHLIGTLQTNKAKDVVGKVALIHSVHKIKLLKELERQCVRQQCEQDILLQLNVAEEESKHGFARAELAEAVAYLEQCPHLHLRGLMCMAPFFEDPADAYPVFAACKQDFDRLEERFGRDKITTLSMGMSHDFPEAIRAGATHIRVGSAIFGARDYAN